MNAPPDTPTRLAETQLIRTGDAFLDWVFASRGTPEAVWYLNPYTLAHLDRGHIPQAAEARVVADGRLMARSIRQGLGGPCESLHFDFSGMAGRVFHAMEERGARLAVLGGKPGEAASFRRHVETRYPKLEIVYAGDGYFHMREAGKVARRIAETRPDVLIVSMGSPRQEEFVMTLPQHTDHPMAAITCGGFVGQTATRRENYYPKVIVKLNLRWVYRLYREPQMYARVMKYYIPYMFRKRLFGPDLPF